MALWPLIWAGFATAAFVFDRKEGLTRYLVGTAVALAVGYLGWLVPLACACYVGRQCI